VGGDTVSDIAPHTISGIVLAGGRGSRMGSDKRLLVVGGMTMLERAVRSVAAVADEVLIASQAEDTAVPGMAPSLGAEMVFDRRVHAGPLAGIEAALAVMRGEVALVVGADMPWLAIPVLRHLTQAAMTDDVADVVALETDWGPQALPAVYRRSILPLVTALLDAGDRRLHALLDHGRPRIIPASSWLPLDPGGRTVCSVNVPADLAAEPDRGP
jgi:molybdopterin-guanine dinucleotide biosynthesis protein A